jgi:hypothetical protein
MESARSGAGDLRSVKKRKGRLQKGNGLDQWIWLISLRRHDPDQVYEGSPDYPASQSRRTPLTSGPIMRQSFSLVKMILAVTTNSPQDGRP